MSIIRVSKDIVNYDKYETAYIVGSLLAGIPVKEPEVGSVTTPNVVAYYLSGGSPTESLLKNIKTGLYSLIKKGVIKDIGKGCYYYIYNSILNIDKYFIYINSKDIYTIMTTDINKKDNLGLLHYYIGLLTTVNNSYKAGFLSAEMLAKKFNKSRATILKYNKMLATIGVMYFYQAFTNNSNGEVRTKVAYCRPEDADSAYSYLFSKGYTTVKEIK